MQNKSKEIHAGKRLTLMRFGGLLIWRMRLPTGGKIHDKKGFKYRGTPGERKRRHWARPCKVIDGQGRRDCTEGDIMGERGGDLRGNQRCCGNVTPSLGMD